LEEFGHPNYGSRLYELIGEPNNERTHELMKILVRECLKQEPRIKEILDIEVKERSRDSVDISITVIPIESEIALNVVFPFYLEVI
jgi:phage baseplate assembly protein W